METGPRPPARAHDGPPNEPDPMKDDSLALEPRRCVGTNRAGERCARAPIPGGSVCALHGGRAPQVQQSAKARLLAGAEYRNRLLTQPVDPRPPCEHCGRSDADRNPVVQACRLVLDRSGFHPSVTVEHVEPRNEVEHASLDELIEHLEALLEETRAMRDAERVLPRDTLLLDAYIVPEDDDVVVPEDDAEPRSIPPGDPTKEPTSD